jgi:hypothetical protein
MRTRPGPQAPARQIGHEPRVRTALRVQAKINASSYADHADCRAVADQNRRARHPSVYSVFGVVQPKRTANVPDHALVPVFV